MPGGIRTHWKAVPLHGARLLRSYDATPFADPSRDSSAEMSSSGGCLTLWVWGVSSMPQSQENCQEAAL